MPNAFLNFCKHTCCAGSTQYIYPFFVKLINCSTAYTQQTHIHPILVRVNLVLSCLLHHDELFSSTPSETKTKLGYNRSAAQFISNPRWCRSNFSLLVPQTGRRSQSINSPWSLLEGVKWWGGVGRGKRRWWHSGTGKQEGLSLCCV